ncbi:Aerobactin siderophore ferric receptor protein IutA [Salmonella enterica subsp. arizonae]|uniref:Aerobactin siderophore ferric receptor protein IutA n=1 Tax=Salmonella enterica subsp. arizonae TaxID=59203 RepID=A0A2X4TJ45_SALER|nr:Aerobactin siderophore ferric receptor protein IutA [Salmonella enterica subsp. arizonae]
MSDAKGYSIDGYTTVDLLGSYQLPVGKLSFSVENLFDRDYTTVWGSAHRCTTALVTARFPVRL